MWDPNHNGLAVEVHHLFPRRGLLEFMPGDQKPGWLEQRLADLDTDDIPAISAAARAFPLTGRKASDLETALGYFEHNAHRMRYAHFKKLSMFTGSGAVEAGCNATVALPGLAMVSHGS
jgi:hypothetical protein